MKPYYESTGLTIYHGDCRDVLPTLSADSVDLIVTDPPYGVNYRSNFLKQPSDFIKGDGSTEVAEQGLALSLRVLKRYRHLYVFGRFNFSTMAVSEPAELIWDKEIFSAGDLQSQWGQQHEYIQFLVAIKSHANKESGRGRLAARLRRGTVLRVPRLNSKATGLHQTEKPVRLMRELIESSSCIGETVLDPFMGSGPVLEAAVIEGRRFIGIEVDEENCLKAVNRIKGNIVEATISQGGLWGAKELKTWR